MQNIEDYKFLYQDEKYFYLYKHVRFSEGSLCIIQDGTLSFTPPSKFNDPFDCLFNIDDDYNYTTNELRDLHARYGCKRLSTAKRLQANQKFKRQQKIGISDSSFFLKFHQRTGVCCLNHNPLEILMWSHYADNHKGFLLEFKFPKSSLKYKTVLKDFIPVPVSYSKDMPTLSKKDKFGLHNSETAKKIYLTKHDSWAYEKEFRVVSNDMEQPIQSYPRDELLCSVILGLKMLPENQERIKNLLKQLLIEVPLYRAEMVEGKYGITVPNHPRLDVLALNKKK